MANQAAIKFVRQLWAAFCRYPISAETKELYGQKLSKWRLTQGQWDTALDRIIEGHESESLPSLSDLYAKLKEAQISENAGNGNMGWASFRLYDRDYSIRIWHDGHTWVISDLVYTDGQGRKTHMQTHVDQPVVNHIPADATDFLITPEKMILRDEEILTPAELRQMFAEIQGNLGRIQGSQTGG